MSKDTEQASVQTFRAPAYLIRELEKKAQANDRTLSAEIRMALRAHLEAK